MKIDTLKQLEAVIRLCNKHGVTAITVDGVEMKLSGDPATDAQAASSTKDGIKTPDQYSDEDFINWSSQTVS